MNHLDQSPVHASALREFTRKQLIELIDKLPVGSKALVLDPCISGPLSLIAEYSLLKERGVEKIYLLGNRLDTDCTSILYLVRPNLSLMKLIAHHVKMAKDGGRNMFFTAAFIPRPSVICERTLEDEGVLGDVIITDFLMNMIPLDGDLLSMEMENCFSDLFFEGNYSCIYAVAQAIQRLQAIHGIIPDIYGKGHYAKILVDMILRMNKEREEENLIFPEINRIIVFDRTIDLFTPFLTQLTYEGFLDEIFGIENTFVELEPYVSGFKEKKKISLNSSDLVFGRIRNQSFGAIGPILSNTAKRLQNDYNERHNAQSVSELREFIGKLGSFQQEHQSLQLHINIRDYIVKNHLKQDFHQLLEIEQNLMSGMETSFALEYAENLIYENAPLAKVLKILCLVSAVTGGLKKKQYDFFRAEICAAYGYKHSLSLEALSTAGLLRVSTTSSSSQKSAFATLRKLFRLKVEDVDDKDPKDIAYVHAVLAPLTCRLVETILDNANASLVTKTGVKPSVWAPVEEGLKLINGPTIEVKQPLAEGLSNPKSQKDTTLVVFLGGCTFAEVSALRFLAQRSEKPRQIAVFTTKMINGYSLVENLISKVSKCEKLSQPVEIASTSS